MHGEEEKSRPLPRGPSDAFDPRAVRDQVERILASREFHATSRMHDFLRFIVEETLAGRSDQLKGYTIATQVFGRGGDFDAAQDPIVRIQAGRLRRALERYYLVAGGQDPILIDMPKGRYIPTFSRRPVERAAAPSPASGQEPSPVPSGPSVAVLPFADLTEGPSDAFFGLGLAEDLVTELSRYQDISVVPCHRSGEAASASQDLTELCRSLGARFLLDGSVRRDATTAKVAARLVDTTTGRQVWARSFKHSLAANHLIATQEEIAASVVAAIGSEYGIIARRLAAESRKKRPAELSTYEAMLRFYSYQIAASPSASTACFEALRAAVDREPDYGPAWSALASLYCQMFVFDVAGFEDPLATGLDHAQRGVALDPGRQTSRLVLAYALLLKGAFDGVRTEAETTLSLNPNNPYAVGTIGYIHVLAGDFDEGRALLDRATAANPVHPCWFHDGYYLDRFWRGDYAEALEIARLQNVTDVWQPALLAAALGRLGRGDEAADARARLLAWKPDFGRRARELIQRSVKSPELVDALVDGLQKAGVGKAEA